MANAIGLVTKYSVKKKKRKPTNTKRRKNGK